LKKRHHTTKAFINKTWKKEDEKYLLSAPHQLSPIQERTTTATSAQRNPQTFELQAPGLASWSCQVPEFFFLWGWRIFALWRPKKVGNFCFCSVNSKQIAKILQKSQNLSKPQKC
jgi:hypothetical protein